MGKIKKMFKQKNIIKTDKEMMIENFLNFILKKMKQNLKKIERTYGGAGYQSLHYSLNKNIGVIFVFCSGGTRMSATINIENTSFYVDSVNNNIKQKIYEIIDNKEKEEIKEIKKKKEKEEILFFKKFNFYKEKNFG